MMGVLGAEFGQEIEPSQRRKDASPTASQENVDTARSGSVVEGFGIANYSHARHTSEWLLR